MVFQDSGSSLNPRKRVVDILREPMLYHGVAKPATVQGRIDELLEQVGLPKEMKHRYPHEFSGDSGNVFALPVPYPWSPR